LEVQLMCFSPQADLIGGLVVSGAGVDALRHVRHRREIALAALPLLFGIHQLVEVLAWLGLDGLLPTDVTQAAIQSYLWIAFVLPLAVPLAIRLIEPDPNRRRAMTPLVIIGAGVTAVLCAELLDGPAAAEVCGRYISYDAGLSFGGEITALYVVATCVPLLLSTVRRLVAFGIANLIAVGALAWAMSAGFISLWCAWAAVASLVIVIHLRSSEERSVVDSAVSAQDAPTHRIRPRR
jgi:uncharacterized membrane protein YhaH (DUF805 family)